VITGSSGSIGREVPMISECWSACWYRRFSASWPGMSQAFTRENVLSAVTFGFGVVAAVCGFVDAWHVQASWTGLTGMALGAVAQMVSTSTAQRWVIVPGWVLAFIGLALGMAHGGLW
jgi:hypothetical protein